LSQAQPHCTSLGVVFKYRAVLASSSTKSEESQEESGGDEDPGLFLFVWSFIHSFIYSFSLFFSFFSLFYSWLINIIFNSDDQEQHSSNSENGEVSQVSRDAMNSKVLLATVSITVSMENC
jgi:heme/copper-type cytochrome/quinol oxidase subunit 3